jgi:hypothetical protein
MSRHARLVAAFSLARMSYGVALLAVPERVGRSWLGEAATLAPVKVALRGLGARDLALSAGALVQATDHGRARPWLLAAVACDLGDIAATVGAGDALSERSRAGTVALAGGSALAGAALARAG